MSRVLLPPPLPMRRFTVDEYHRMLAAGVLRDGDPFELLEGWIVAKMSRNPPHDTAIGLTDAALSPLTPAGWYVRVQCAITTSESEPEPDLTLVRGNPRTYAKIHPGPADIALIVEVANTTLAADRGTKLQIYARAGIAVYWIVNLDDRQVEVYTDPTGPMAAPHYRHRQDYPVGTVVPVDVLGQPVGTVAVMDLLP